jgi:hypothetical protein
VGNCGASFFSGNESVCKHASKVRVFYRGEQADFWAMFVSV